MLRSVINRFKSVLLNKCIRTIDSDIHRVNALKLHRSKLKVKQNTVYQPPSATHQVLYDPWLTLFNKSQIAPSVMSSSQIAPSVMSSSQIAPSVMSCSFTPPSTVRGMKTLDKNLFSKKACVPGIVIPNKSIADVNKVLKSNRLTVRKISHIVLLDKSDERFSTHRLFLLDPEKNKTYNDLADNIKEFLTNKIGVKEDEFQSYTIELTYDNWNFSEIIRAIVPEDQANVSSFTQIGHIAHVNLEDHSLPYKTIIGELLLDKSTVIKTVVNKLQTIDNTYRNFQMELLAGEENYVTRTKENGCVFEMDFSKVYWNSRLSTEHGRIVREVEPDDIVFDVFAGIGPFAVPAAKKHAVVYANDLNPASYDSLKKNVKLNKCPDLNCYNLDGRQFIKSVVKDKLLEYWKDSIEREVEYTFHIVMNLPALAVEFLDAFNSLLSADSEWTSNEFVTLPKVCCYCFTTGDIQNMKAEDIEQEVKDRVQGIVGDSVAKTISARFVRNVSTNKDMMCATFSLTWDILIGSQTDEGEPPEKIRKLDSASGS